MVRQYEERRWWPVLAPLVLIVIAISLLLPAGRHQWALSLFRQPSRYTALSFNRASALPTTAPKNDLISISFTIGNHEGRTIKYRYVVTEAAAGKSHALKQATRVVGADTVWSVSLLIRPSCAGSPCRVQVTLPGHPETIDFLMALSARPTARG